MWIVFTNSTSGRRIYLRSEQIVSIREGPASTQLHTQGGTCHTIGEDVDTAVNTVTLADIRMEEITLERELLRVTNNAAGFETLIEDAKGAQKECEEEFKRLDEKDSRA